MLDCLGTPDPKQVPIRGRLQGTLGDRRQPCSLRLRFDMRIPQTEFVSVGDQRVAYQVLGEGPTDLVFSGGAWTHVDLWWEDRTLARFSERVSTFARFILFDRRGTGASDPLTDVSRPWWEYTLEDLSAVVDAVGCERPAFMGYLGGVGPILAFAASKPDRVHSLILMTGSARFVAAPDYPIGSPPERFEELIALVTASWGTPEGAAAVALSRAHDRTFLEGMAKFQRSISSAAGVRDFLRSELNYDVRDLLPSVQCPTLVLHAEENPIWPVAHSRYLAEQIAGARLEVFPGADIALFYEHERTLLPMIEEFLTGERRTPDTERVLATVLFTDIVGSTEQAAALGDRAWRAKLEQHDDIAASVVERFGGRLVKTSGDEVLATFDGPGRAIACAQTLASELDRVHLPIRAGVHTGEVELRGSGDIGGIAVHISRRIMDLASPREVLVSRTIRDLVSGSGIEFEARGTHNLKGVPDKWELLAVI